MKRVERTPRRGEGRAVVSQGAGDPGELHEMVEGIRARGQGRRPGRASAGGKPPAFAATVRSGPQCCGQGQGQGEAGDHTAA